MLTKVKLDLKFNPKRNSKLITPCCNSNTKDFKFATFIDLPEHYGKCFSCGKRTLPPTIYKDDNNLEYVWNKNLKKFEPFTNSIISEQLTTTKHVTKELPKQQFIDEAEIWKSYNLEPENNLLKYLRNNYENNVVELAKELYVLGTSKDFGTIFWQISKDLKIQKSKISYYKLNGKRTKKYKVPYKNENGFYSCLFGEHLLSEFVKNNGIVILVESEKTAIVGQILLSKYVWIAYGGATNLTDSKTDILIGYNVLIVPDMSSNAVKIIEDKLPYLLNKGIKANLWDMRNGLSDEELDHKGLLGADLEDIFRSLPKQV
jgi:hypothetical protein